MAFTTAGDFAEYHQGVTPTDWQMGRLPALLEIAEATLETRVGRTFYEGGSRTTTPSREWILATCVVVEHYLAAEAPPVREALASPDVGASLSGQNTTRRQNPLAGTDPFPDADGKGGDWRVAGIIARYKALATSAGVGSARVYSVTPGRA